MVMGSRHNARHQWAGKKELTMSNKAASPAPLHDVVLTSRETIVLTMMEQGYRLWPVKMSRLYGLFKPGELQRPAELVQRRIVESLKSKGKIKIGYIDSTSEYVLDR